VRARRVLVGLLLDVVGHDDRGHRSAGERDAQRAVDQVARLRRHHQRLHELAGDVLVERVEVDLLLVVGAERAAGLLADDRHHRLVVELGVVEAVEEVDGAGARRGQADADLAGELRVRARGEGGELLVADLRELDLVADLVERAQDPVDAVAGIAVDALDAPFGEPLEHELAYVHAARPTPP
jgi:hypothetical protein